MSIFAQLQPSHDGNRLLYEGGWDYRGANQIAARCHVFAAAIQIRGSGRPAVLVIATELQDNPGASITNAAEQVAQSLFGPGGPAAAFDVEQLLMIERYGELSFPEGLEDLPETLERVRFTRLSRRLVGVPKWRPLERAHIELLEPFLVVSRRAIP